MNNNSQKNRLTPIREAMFDFFKQSSEPADYSQIEECLNSKGIKANKTTIYRQLDFLLKTDYISELDFGEGKKRYEIKKQHHHHLLCTGCQKIECVDVDSSVHEEIQNVEDKFLENNKFKVKSHMLEFFGLCGRCQEKKCNKY